MRVRENGMERVCVCVCVFERAGKEGKKKRRDTRELSTIANNKSLINS